MQKLVRFFYRYSSLLVVVLTMTGCSDSTSRAPSFLIIAVEGLGFESLSCGNVPSGTQPQGFEVLCQDSVRFTHAYTTSTMSQSALSSLLTGLYPHEHRVIHNGSNFLTAEIDTVAEVAHAKGYRTGFFSGGPPVFRNSGMAQGFEIFEDFIPIQWTQMFRPVQDSFKLFENWLEGEVGDDSFFSVIYVADLQFPESETRSEIGEVRSRTYESQLNELSESMGTLFQHLKAKKRWDQTHVIMVGVNALPKIERNSELHTVDLRSDRTQVALLFKPARKKRDQGIEWTIDANVNIADVGVTIYDYLDYDLATNQLRYAESRSHFPLYSLQPALTKPQVTWDTDRLLLVSSSWPTWRGLGDTRYGFRRGHFLAVYDRIPRVYNSLIDRMEGFPLGPRDEQRQSFLNSLSPHIQYLNITPWGGLDPLLVEKFILAPQVLTDEPLSAEIEDELIDLSMRSTKDKQVRDWRALKAFQSKDWMKIFDIGQEQKKTSLALVAARNMKVPYKGGAPECAGIFYRTWKLSDLNVRNCPDELMNQLGRWVLTFGTSDESLHREEFLTQYRLLKLQERAAQLNYQRQLTWDTILDRPAGPWLVDLYLSLNSSKYFNQLAQQFLKAK